MKKQAIVLPFQFESNGKKTKIKIQFSPERIEQLFMEKFPGQEIELQFSLPENFAGKLILQRKRSPLPETLSSKKKEDSSNIYIYNNKTINKKEETNNVFDERSEEKILFAQQRQKNSTAAKSAAGAKSAPTLPIYSSSRELNLTAQLYDDHFTKNNLSTPTNTFKDSLDRDFFDNLKLPEYVEGWTSKQFLLFIKKLYWETYGQNLLETAPLGLVYAKIKNGLISKFQKLKMKNIDIKNYLVWAFEKKSAKVNLNIGFLTYDGVIQEWMQDRQKVPVGLFPARVTKTFS